VNTFFAALAAGLAFSAYTAIGALGFSMQFATTNVLNLAYGDLMTLGAFVTYTVQQHGVTNIWAAGALGVLTACLGSYVLGRFFIIPATRRGMSAAAVILCTLGVSLVIEAGIDIIWTAQSESYGLPATTAVRWGAFIWTPEDLICVCAALVLLPVTWLLLSKTSLGRFMRAVTSNRDLALTSGVRVDRIIGVSWLISGLLCGIAGVLLGAESITFNAATGFTFTIVIVAAAFVGGIGNMGGAVLGSVLVGVVSQLASAYSDPAYNYVFAFGILALVLVFRPRGIFSDVSAQREMVR
jgi:branched-subunit amino acid ABC-type transport system permease component